jgi:uncharacterized damage-inducible protein DinB
MEEGGHAMMHAPEVEAMLADMAASVEVAGEKILGLAQAIGEEHWDWRPGEGVRSVREVFMHVTADNYFFPAALGVAAPASTGIDGQEYSATLAYEQRSLSRDQVIQELTASFPHVVEAMQGAAGARIAEELELFGRTYTQREFWVLMTTHVHEHLGQLIAYARSNGVVPPWSR